ncbi:MAG: hypothetical protein ABWJ98_02575 [Hydrogenothermaceae bacterium]
MPSFKFHEEKLDEILKSYENSNLFIKGVTLFYIAVHSIDYCLSRNFQIDDISTHRGRKKYINEFFDEKTASLFSEILSYSLIIRYTDLTDLDTIQKMKEALKDLLNILSSDYNFPSQFASKIINFISQVDE